MEMHALCRRAAAEGAVLLKNDNACLPFSRGTKLAVFGRAQTFYYKSGTGSGGMVHIDKEPCTIESLEQCPDLTLDEPLKDLYRAWVKRHPFNDGGGRWGGEPWFQEEMPLDEDTVRQAAARNDAALVVLARTAGEDHDNADRPGSYRLTSEEERMLSLVTAHFERVAVVLNVGNVIDTSFLERYPISSLLYVWQGGMAGADALADLLTGRQVPCGKLTDTIAFRLEDHPAFADFGHKRKNRYREDIYVGYRYFETFQKDAVQFPFGFGLSYTSFERSATVDCDGDTFTVQATVTNVGDRRGKEVVQVYFQAPCGKLGTPSRQLIAFAKTKELAPNESQTLTMSFPLDAMASYDDGGVTGHPSSYVLEEGNYEIYVGSDVRSASSVYTYTLDALRVVRTLQPILPPTDRFERTVAVEENEERRAEKAPVPIVRVDTEKRIAERRPAPLEPTEDRGITLADVYRKAHTLEAFLAQLSDADLAALCCGEGMNSPKATPGTGGALGGQTTSLAAFGIPVCAVTDGPSGLRLDDGTKASSIPNGTLLACTWDTALVEEVYTRIGAELKEHAIDALLGPGINLHRHPLCGRNFEYFSEDPLLSGKIAVAVTKGIAAHGAYATIKHLCCNNQETARHRTEAIVSERALRELYLKPFEIAVKEGERVAVMTAYNPVNGFCSASNFDIIATVLRDEWGFDGLVMTDWWACCNLHRHARRSRTKLQAMIRAKGDVYMVCFNAALRSRSILKGLKKGYITRGELQERAAVICRWILDSVTFKNTLSPHTVTHTTPIRDDAVEVATIRKPVPGTAYTVALQDGAARLKITLKSHTAPLAQTTVTVRIDDAPVTFSVGGGTVTVERLCLINGGGEHTITVQHPKVVRIRRIAVEQ